MSDYTWVEMQLAELRTLARNELPELHDDVHSGAVTLRLFHWNAYQAFVGDRFEAAGSTFTRILTRIDGLLWHTATGADRTVDGVKALVQNYIENEDINAERIEAAYNDNLPGGPGAFDGGGR